MNTIQTITLTQTNWKIPANVHAVQNDTGRILRMIVADQELPVDATAELAVKRSDGSYYNIECELDGEYNAFECDLTQALTQAGDTECQLKVDGIVSTYMFIINVQKDVAGIDTEQYGYTVEEIMDAISSVVDYTEELQDIRNGYDGTQYPTAGDAVRAQIIDALTNSGLTDAAKQALLNAFAHVAWIDEYGQNYYDALENELYPPVSLLYITAEFSQGAVVIYDTDSLDDLKQYLVVTAHFTNGSSAVVSSYTLSGSLVVGNSTITATYEGKSAKFVVEVTQTPGMISVINNLTNATNSNPATYVQENTSYSATIIPNPNCMISSVVITMGGVDITSTAYDDGDIAIASVTGTLEITVVAVAIVVTSISAVYTQSGDVLDTDSLDSLKDDLVVTATYSDSSTAIVPSTDYLLSGTLTVGTSVITVGYSGKTTTFNVTVTSIVLFQAKNYTLNKSTQPIDTGVPILSTDRTYTIFLDAYQETSENGGKATRLLLCMDATTNPQWKGIYSGGAASMTYHVWQWMNWQSSNQSFLKNAANSRFRVAYVHEAGTNTVKFYSKLNNDAISAETSTAQTLLYPQSNLYVGDTTISNNFIGTINEVTVYNVAFTAEQIAELMA